MGRRVFTVAGWVDYVGPGWYKDGVLVSVMSSCRSVPGCIYLDLENDKEVARMIDEGCPNTSQYETPPAVKKSFFERLRVFWVRIKDWLLSKTR